MVNGYSIVTYQRPLKANDELDRQIITNGSQAIVWAIGPLNERNEVSFHSDYLKTDRFIEFGRPPAWNCPMPDQEQAGPVGDNSDKGSSNKVRSYPISSSPFPTATKNKDKDTNFGTVKNNDKDFLYVCIYFYAFLFVSALKMLSE